MSNVLRGLVHRGDIEMFYEKVAEAKALIASAEAAVQGNDAEISGRRFSATVSATVSLHMAVGCLNAAAAVADWASKNSMAGAKRIDYEAREPR